MMFPVSPVAGLKCHLFFVRHIFLQVLKSSCKGVAPACDTACTPVFSPLSYCRPLGSSVCRWRKSRPGKVPLVSHMVHSETLFFALSYFPYSLQVNSSRKGVYTGKLTRPVPALFCYIFVKGHCGVPFFDVEIRGRG